MINQLSAGIVAHPVEAAAAALEDVTRVSVQAVVDTFGNQSMVVLSKARGQPVLGSQAQLVDLLKTAVAYARA